MRRRVACWLVVFVMSLDTATALVLNVPLDFPTIQMGIDAASPGDTIQIAPGEYVESLVIGKDLTLRGEGFETALRSPGIDDVTLSITGASVTIRDLRFEGLALNQFFTKRAIEAHQTTLKLRNVHIKRYTFSHLHILDGHLDLEDVHIGPCEEEGAPFPCGNPITASDLGLRITHSTFIIRRLRGGHLPPGTNIAGGTDHLIDPTARSTPPRRRSSTLASQARWAPSASPTPAPSCASSTRRTTSSVPSIPTPTPLSMTSSAWCP